MPISKQEQSGEYLSIKQVILSQINRCNEALSNYSLKSHNGEETGARAAISSVDVLTINIIDFGDAPIKTEYQKWWSDNKSNLSNKYPLSIARLRLEKIINILNKYQMLHDSLPRGYSNVTLEGVKEVK